MQQNLQRFFCNRFLCLKCSKCKQVTTNAFPENCIGNFVTWQVTSSFHTAMERLGQLGLVERLSGDTVVETVEERIKEQVTLKKKKILEEFS